MRLANFDPGAFLRDHWQQAPLLIRDAWDAWRDPLDPDELAGLACEPGVESRLVTGDPGAPRTLSLEHGPFEPARFARLGDRDWTLLVQAVDHHDPDVAALISSFRFIPDWRIDDVMVSYAAEGGGVGPHTDQYDVFLIQGLGRRRWRVGPRCHADTALLPHDELRLLADFRPSHEWLLEPGDILYLPPGFAHDGVAADGPCMTYSIGFRAPSRAELVSAWSDDVLSRLPEDDRYADPGLALQSNPGEITAAALALLQTSVVAALSDRARFADWFGRHATTPKYPETDWRPERALAADAVAAALAAGIPLARNPASRFAFVRDAAADAGEGGSVTLFVDGAAWPCSGNLARFAQALCAGPHLAPDPATAADPAIVNLVTTLCNAGALAFAEDD
ncbi:MAG: cupin domain-containing protein [Sphingomonadales bacterium]|nr:cupin domain-containing protein [Sphingomonadales bacterium]